VKLACAIAVAAVVLADAHAAPPLPARLSETGLFAPGVQAFAPQYPLWSDGAAKRRWISLPPGTTIDARNVDAWSFPPGTKLWKEFAFDRPVETRMIERLPDGAWRFSAYVWNAAGTDAELVPPEGVRALPVPSAPNGRYAVPSRADCLACHEGAPAPVLGFSAVQLGPQLREWTARGIVTNVPAAMVAAPLPLSPALGYLHGNCGHCHNEAGAVAGIDLVLAQSAADPAASARRTRQSLFGRASRYREAGTADAERADVIVQRMQSDSPYSRMPPLGVSVVDREGVALVGQWLDFNRKENHE